MKEMKVRLTFIDEILGGNPGNEDIYRTYIGSKSLLWRMKYWSPW